MRRTLVLLAILLAFGCGKENKSANKNLNTGLPADSLITVKIRADTSQSYILYLPPGYSDNGTFPVIFAFDSHGNGKKIASWLRPAARRYGYVIAASNSFRNNVPNLGQILDNLQNDVFRRLNVDKTRLYTAGFSGGGRIATYWAAADKRFKGAASLSAGLSMSLINNIGFGVILFAGKRDFNYNEIIKNSPQIAQNNGIPLQIVVFDGGHEYPPRNYSQYAVLWFEVNAVRQGLKKKTSRLVKQVQNFTDSLIANARTIDEKIAAYQTAVNYLDGLKNTKHYAQKLAQLQQSEEYREYLQKTQKINNLEAYLQQQYLKALQTQSLQWWQREIQAINEKIKTETDPDYRALYYRLKAYISIVCFSLSRDLLQSGQIEQAGRIIKIYELDDPQNPDVYFYKAALYAIQNKPGQAVEQYKKALELGFNDYQRLNQYPDLKKLVESQ